MVIALVVNDQNIVTPIVEGTVLRFIQDDFTVEDVRNPALDLTEGRRGTTLRAAIEKGATTFIAPPTTFCEKSYEKALEQQITFYNIASNQSFDAILAALKQRELTTTTALPSVEVVPSV